MIFILSLPDKIMSSIKDEDVFDYYPKLAEYANLRGGIARIFGGFFGVAYRCGDKTLKITEDEQEAYVALKLVGKYHPNVYHIHKVFKINRLTKKYGDNIYGIVYDYINKTGYSDEIINIFNMFDEKVFVNKWPGSKEFIEICKRCNDIENLDYDEKYVYLANIFGLDRAWKDDFMKKLDYFLTPDCLREIKYLDQMKSGLEFIKANTGIVPRDIHVNNVLIDGDRLVFIDLGITESNRNIDMPLLERLDKRNRLG